MEQLASSISAVVTNETEAAEICLFMKEQLGVSSLHDLKYVEERDLIPRLKPIIARKLIQSWKFLYTSGKACVLF